MGEAFISLGKRGPLGPQRTPDAALTADEQRLGGAHIRRFLEDPGNIPGKDLHGRPKRPHRCLGILMELIPRLLLPLIVEEEEGFRGAVAPEPERLPTPLIGVAPRGDKVAAPQDGPQFARPSSKASEPPAVDASGTLAVDVLGLPSAKEVGPRSPTSATAAALSLWPRLGRSGTTTSGGSSTIPTSGATGGSTGESVTAPAGVDAGASNRSGGLRAMATSAVSSDTMVAPTEGSARGTCPLATRAAWAPRSRALCAEASQLAWCAAAPAAEASPVLRAFLGARPVELCLRFPLRTRANRACGEAPRASALSGTVEGSPAADSGAASTSGARGAKGEST